MEDFRYREHYFSINLESLMSYINNFDSRQQFINYYKDPPFIPAKIHQAIEKIDILINEIKNPEDYEKVWGESGKIFKILNLSLEDKLKITHIDQNDEGVKQETIKNQYSILDILKSKEYFNFQQHPVIAKLFFYKVFQDEYKTAKDFELTSYIFNPEKRIIKKREMLLFEQLSKKYNFLSVSISKKNFRESLHLLKKGINLVQNLYGLSSEDVGGGLLFIKINQQRGQGMAAYYAGINTIAMYDINESFSSNFVHEYTHHLQFTAFKINYLNVSPDFLKGLSVWNKIEEKLSSFSVNFSDVQKLNNNLWCYIEDRFKEDKAFIEKTILNEFTKDTYKKTLLDYVEKIPKTSYQQYENISNVVDRLIITHEVFKEEKGLKEFEKRLWAKGDEVFKIKNMSKYFNHTLEMHSRLAESYCNINKKPSPNAIWYLLDSTKEELKPLTTQFNSYLISEYKKVLSIKEAPVEKINKNILSMRSNNLNKKGYCH